MNNKKNAFGVKKIIILLILLITLSSCGVKQENTWSNVNTWKILSNIESIQKIDKEEKEVLEKKEEKTIEKEIVNTGSTWKIEKDLSSTIEEKKEEKEIINTGSISETNKEVLNTEKSWDIIKNNNDKCSKFSGKIRIRWHIGAEKCIKNGCKVIETNNCSEGMKNEAWFVVLDTGWCEFKCVSK